MRAGNSYQEYVGKIGKLLV